MLFTQSSIFFRHLLFMGIVLVLGVLTQVLYYLINNQSPPELFSLWIVGLFIIVTLQSLWLYQISIAKITKDYVQITSQTEKMLWTRLSILLWMIIGCSPFWSTLDISKWAYLAEFSMIVVSSIGSFLLGHHCECELFLSSAVDAERV